MKKFRLTINSNEVKSRAIYIINNLDINKPCEVLIREYKIDRSALQNALYWKWLTIIGAELGETKDDLHERYKAMFLVPIYERDDPEYAEMLSALRGVWGHDRKAGNVLYKKIVKLTSTTQASIKQFTEYLNDIELAVRGLNIWLSQ